MEFLKRVEASLPPQHRADFALVLEGLSFQVGFSAEFAAAENSDAKVKESCDLLRTVYSSFRNLALMKKLRPRIVCELLDSSLQFVFGIKNVRTCLWT